MQYGKKMAIFIEELQKAQLWSQRRQKSEAGGMLPSDAKLPSGYEVRPTASVTVSRGQDTEQT